MVEMFEMNIINNIFAGSKSFMDQPGSRYAALEAKFGLRCLLQCSSLPFLECLNVLCIADIFKGEINTPLKIKFAT